MTHSWLADVAAFVTSARPDLHDVLVDVLGVEPSPENPLEGLSIGGIGSRYEQMLAETDRTSRKAAGQFFTPDDVAHFMAEQSLDFPTGIWLDPSCGVGNLSWYLASVQPDPSAFVRNHLVMGDTDPVALRTAVALVASAWADDASAVRALAGRCQVADYLRDPLPEHDFVMSNPPYAKASVPGFETSSCGDLFAFFTERTATTSKGFITVTPAAWMSLGKFQPLRDVLNRRPGGRVWSFDNSPDTLFTGFKHGSTNTSKRNFVRAAITVCHPDDTTWQTSPLVRWNVAERPAMLARVRDLLSPLNIGPHGEWVKGFAGLEDAWSHLATAPRRLADLVSQQPTGITLSVGLTGRYYSSAAWRRLNRSSVAVLHFTSEADRDRAAIVLNSSAAYLWWRSLSGEMTVTNAILLSTPIPDMSDTGPLSGMLRGREDDSIVVKHNAGMAVENVKHSAETVAALDLAVFGQTHDFKMLYSPTTTR